MEGPGNMQIWELMAPMDIIQVSVRGGRFTGSGGITRSRGYS